jgi:integrase
VIFLSESKKASNGAGSMRYIESKKLYCYRVTVGTDSLGKPIRKAFYAKTEKETRQKGIAAQARVLQGQVATESQDKISTWALQWVENYKGGLAARTLQNYKDVINAQIIPRIGKYSFKKIKPAHIQKMLTDLVKEGKSKSLVSRVRILTNAMMEDALDNEMLIKNPCRKIKLPRMDGSEEKKPFTEAEKKKLYELMPKYLSPYKPHNPRLIGRIIIILLKTGMRQEELLALRWEDIDFKNNEITIVRALDIDKDDPTKAPKSAASARTIPMHPEVCQQFKDIGIQDKGYIFYTRTGNLFRPDNFRRDFRIFLEAAGVEYRAPHVTRHTFASDLRAAGVDVKTISKLLGHSKVNISLDVYIHTNSAAEKAAIEKL